MSSHQEDIASKLLHSADARIAEAAKRVFSSSSLSTPLPAGVAASLAALSSAAPPAQAQAPPPLAAPSGAFGDSPVFPFPSAGEDLYDQQNAAVFHGGHNNNGGGAEYAANINNNPGVAESMASNDEVADDAEGSEKKPSSTERLKRSRERNRMHARKTRQRKKEHMQKLQNRADELKLEQMRLKQAINEKNTASILVGLLQTGDGDGGSADSAGQAVAVDPKVEVLLKRSTEDIPDASKIPELPALILPGQHNGKRKSTDGDGDGEGTMSVPDDLQEDGIDYALLGKDRSACSPAELDQIRRERNRMHAKRTRDRKRIFMEEMEVMIKQLEDDNMLLQRHMNKLNANQPLNEAAPETALYPETVTPELCPISAPSSFAPLNKTCDNDESEPPRIKGDFQNQIESLLAAAGSFQKKSSQCEINAISCAESDVTASTNHSDHNSFCEDDDDDYQLSEPHPNKRQRTTSDLPTSVPTSITTTNISL